MRRALIVAASALIVAAAAIIAPSAAMAEVCDKGRPDGLAEALLVATMALGTLGLLALVLTPAFRLAPRATTAVIAGLLGWFALDSYREWMNPDPFTMSMYKEGCRSPEGDVRVMIGASVLAAVFAIWSSLPLLAAVRRRLAGDGRGASGPTGD